MAINQRRPDTPLADTSDPKSIDPIVNRTKSTDPETGVTTYKHTWSNSYGKRTSAPTTKTTTPLVKKTSSEPVKKTSSGSSSGSRTFTSLPRLTPAGKTEDTKPSAPIPTETQLSKNTKTRADNLRAIYAPSYNKTKKPGQSFEDWNKQEWDRVKENSRKAKEPRGSKLFFSIDDPSNNCKSCYRH